MKKIELWLREHKRTLLVAAGIAIGCLVFVQLVYPRDRLLPAASIDGFNVSAWKVDDASWKLDEEMKTMPLAVHVGKTDEVYDSPKPSDIGLSISNRARVEDQTYPWYIRLVPTSLFWYHSVQADGTPKYTSDEKVAKAYLEKQLGTSCNIPAKDASLKFEEDSLRVVSAKNGGICNESNALKALTQARPLLSKNKSITIPVTIKTPKVSDAVAEKLLASLNNESKDGITIEVSGKKQTIEQKEVLSWLDFTTKDTEVVFTINEKRSNAYFAKNVTPLVSKPAGQTSISTLDFAVTSRKTGATGQTLALTSTLASITQVLKGASSTAKASTTALAPTVVYKRSYTKTSNGIAALLAHYDEDNAGVFGVSFQELGGAGKSAQHNGTRNFVTASTYKLFVAYGTLRNVDSGKWKWSMQVDGGRNLTKCFDDMIVKSDNECAQALLKKLGPAQLTKDIHALGLNGSGFVTGDTPNTTPNDLTSFLTKLEGGSLPLKSSSRSTLISAMKRNVYRQGIPAGTSGTVADKVGFLWALLHDASIVYSPKGTYVLVIMTDGSSWGNIAELTRKIESLR